MCFFRSPPPPARTPVAPAPPPMQPLNPQTQSQLPRKKELVDPDERAGVEFGAKAKVSASQAKQGIGANALKIPVKPTKVAQAASQGGVNVSP